MTGTICSVAICKSNAVKAKEAGEKVLFFRFPKDALRRKEWIRKCNRQDKWNSENKRICHKHFVPDDFEDAMQARLLNLVPSKLKSTAIPSLFLHPTQTTVPESSRSKRMFKKEQKQITEDLLSINQSNINLASQDIILTHCESPLQELQIKYDKLSQQLEETEARLARANELNLTLENQLAEQRTNVLNEVEEILLNIFTPNQIDIIMEKKSKAWWNAKEIARAFTLRYFSKRAYIYLRQTLKYPLPGISTLQKWAGNMDLQSGLLKDILIVMKTVGRRKTELQKLTVLSFDEMKIASTYEYDPKEDVVIGPHHYMQVIMARGLFDQWKQPIFVGFDTKITKQLLDEVIQELHAINYRVISCVSDCGSSNVGLWKELNINVNKTYYLHLITKNKIFFFADVPHLLKLLRNWLIDHGFKLSDGQLITKEPLLKLLEHKETEINSCHKLSMLHLTCTNVQRQKVSLAAELFSNTTATALLRYLPGEDKHLAQNVGMFIQIINRWFDIFNSYTPTPSVSTKLPYGRKLEEQFQTLEETKNIINGMRCLSKSALQLFQKGIIISTTSLQDLYLDLKEKFQISYILTHRLNQDCLENLFSQLRTRGGLHDHPSPLNAIYRLRMILLGKNPGRVQQNTNINSEEDYNQDYMLTYALQRAAVQNKIIATKDEVINLEANCSYSNICDDGLLTVTITEQPSLENDGLEYLAGYLAKKYKNRYPELGAYTHELEKCDMHTYAAPSWVQSLSFGGLIKPSQSWLNQVQQMDQVFLHIHNDSFVRDKGIVNNTVTYIGRKLTNIPLTLVRAFTKQRIFIRIKYLNTNMQKTTAKRKLMDGDRKISKKMKKIL